MMHIIRTEVVELPWLV